MAIIDCRVEIHLPLTRCFDAQTGEHVRFVFYYDTETHQVGRYDAVRFEDREGRVWICGHDGKPLSDGLPVIWETRPLRLESIP